MASGVLAAGRFGRRSAFSCPAPLPGRPGLWAGGNVRCASNSGAGPQPFGNDVPLAERDPELHAMIGRERIRQFRGLELIASENFTSRSVMEALGSCLTNKYSEGYPGARYYGGNEVIDDIERLCQSRALGAYGVDAEEWGVNVQPLSGSPANFQVYTALLEPHDRIMGLDLPDGGHLTHGYYTGLKDGSVKKISATSVYFESLPYGVDPATGLIDYDRLASLAAVYKPKLLICGSSAYPRDLEYGVLRQVADSCGALLLCDMAHASGLIAAGELASPFEHCDVVTSTTHKTLRGPRSGLIFARRHLMPAIDFAVFPMLQGGPHNHQIAALATQLKEVASPEFRAYIRRVMDNAAALAEALVDRGNVLATGGTSNHLMLWDLRPHGITGSKMELACDAVGITLNKNTIVGDKNALSPGAVRIGTPALTSRGFGAPEFVRVADLLMDVVELSMDIQATEGKALRSFKAALATHRDVPRLRAAVEDLATAFPMPGLHAH